MHAVFFLYVLLVKCLRGGESRQSELGSAYKTCSNKDKIKCQN